MNRDPAETADLGGSHTPQGEPFAETFDDRDSAAPSTLNFPCTQAQICEAVGLSPGTVSNKLKFLSKQHGQSSVFVDRHGQRLVTAEGYGLLLDLNAAGSVPAYLTRLDAISAAQQAPELEIAPPPAYHQPTGTTIAPRLTLVPRNGTTIAPATPYGFPVASTGTLAGYHQPTQLAPTGQVANDLASELIEAVRDRLYANSAQTQAELDAIASQNAALEQAEIQLGALIAAAQADNIRSQVALTQGKHQLTIRLAALNRRADQAGFNIEGLDTLLQAAQ